MFGSFARAFSLLSFLLVVSLPATSASPDYTLVPRSTQYRTRSITVKTMGDVIAPADFVKVVMDCTQYPLSATYLGVQALVQCENLDARPDGTRIVYMRTGGAAVVSARHWVIALKVVSQTDKTAVIEWDLITHTSSDDAISGPYAATPNKHPDAVWTTYNTGGWKLDNTTGTITYWVTTDPGGMLPSAFQTDGAVMTFPKELMRVKWGIEAE